MTTKCLQYYMIMIRYANDRCIRVCNDSDFFFSFKILFLFQKMTGYYAVAFILGKYAFLVRQLWPQMGNILDSFKSLSTTFH